MRADDSSASKGAFIGLQLAALRHFELALALIPPHQHPHFARLVNEEMERLRADLP